MWAMLRRWVMKDVKNEGGERIWLVATLLTQLDDKKIVTFGYNHYVLRPSFIASNDGSYSVLGVWFVL